ncbi:MAG TPA: response regulator transcription factor [Promineifilum sp.]|nr:response regulator transcription factor [Promineifilum sp.]HRQ14723.1 response regulator transcription factor [Promineifilum sp.]
MIPRRILIVDDEPQLQKTIRAYLEREGYAVESAADGHAALDAAAAFRPDLVILDVMLPGLGGFTVLESLRRQSDVYVLMLTARADEIDKVMGLTLGADDYMTKPFSPRELVARVRAILRRERSAPGDAAAVPDEVALAFARLRLEPAARRVWKDEREVELTPIEYDLLYTLARHAGRVLSREQLIEHVWGYDYYGDDRIIDTHIRRLRRKIEDDPATPAFVVTVRGTGYRFEGRPK